MKFAKFVAVIAAFTAVHSLPSHAKTLEKQVMRDWSVECNARRYCVAQTDGISTDGEIMVFKLERGNKIDAHIFVTTAPKGKTLTLQSHITVDIVGHDYSFHGPVQKVYDGNEAAFAETFTNKSIQKLREGRFAQVTVKFGGDGGTVAYDVSLQGVSSVLAMMDVVQGRLDRQDAVVIRGGESNSLTSYHDLSAGLAPPKPDAGEKEVLGKDPEEDIVYPDDEPSEESGIGDTVLEYDAAKLPDRVLMPGYRMLGCDLPSSVEAYGAKIINLAPGQFLYLVPCSNADLNIPYYAALEDAGAVDTLEFQVPASATAQPSSLLINADWNQSRGGLFSHQYYSSNRDCGRQEFHTFSEQESRFYLSEFREKPDCDGAQTRPSSYPMEWNGEGD